MLLWKDLNFIMSFLESDINIYYSYILSHAKFALLAQKDMLNN